MARNMNLDSPSQLPTPQSLNMRMTSKASKRPCHKSQMLKVVNPAAWGIVAKLTDPREKNPKLTDMKRWTSQKLVAMGRSVRSDGVAEVSPTY